MPNKLRNMKITSIDLVENGANQEANIDIVKGRENLMHESATPEKANGIEEVLAKSGMTDEQVTELSRQIASLILENTAQQETVVETAKSVETTPEQDQEQPQEQEVEKSFNEEIIKKFEGRIESLQKSNEELAKKLAIRDLEEITKKYEAIGYDKTELANKLYFLKGVNSEIYNDFIKVLDDSLNTQQTSGVFKEYGTSKSNEGSNDRDVLIKQFMEQGLSEPEAYLKIATERPDLLQEYDNFYRGI